jgi:hypothetical protein
MAIKINNDTVIFDDKVFKVGSGTTAQRPVPAFVGMVRYNTDEETFEGYDGTQWAAIGSADSYDGFLPGGEKIYDEDVTIDNGKINVAYEGDIVVETGNTLTIADGSSVVLNPFDVETSSVDELLVHKTLYVGRKAEFVTVGTGVGNITATSTSITGIQTTNNIAVGQVVKPISGIIDTGTTISAASGTTITLSKASVNTSTQSDITFNFGYFDEEKSGIILDGETGLITGSKGVNFGGGIISAGGIQLSGSEAAVLDDYEEGTFTPVVQGSTTAGTATYGARVGRYTKIGRQVYFEFDVSWSSGTGTGLLRINGLPFTSANINTFPVVNVWQNNITLTANNVIQAFVENQNTYLRFDQVPVGGGANSNVDYDVAGRLTIAGTYTV